MEDSPSSSDSTLVATSSTTSSTMNSGETSSPSQFILDQATKQQKPNPEYQIWNRQDQLLSAWLQSSLSESTMILIVGLTTSREIWQTLKITFASYRISNDDQILHILSGLGSDYDAVMVTITSQSDSWRLQDVYSLLLGFEARLESLRFSSINTEGSQPSANQVSQTSHPYTNRGRGNNQHYRGGRGNFRGRGRGRENKTICQVCGGPGHTADKCWHRFDHNYGPPNHQQQTSQQGQSHQVPFQNPALHMARVPPTYAPSESSYENIWYPDSGATNHVSNNLANLNTASEYQGGNRLQMGNGTGVDIAHIGHQANPSQGHS
ncbi:hypothetical protein C2S51_021022 [Perilla frutescens var. frutescens]|nr:hypothetical protein C2S51_021022 [Perilla frutescens var. frutescens]